MNWKEYPHLFINSGFKVRNFDAKVVALKLTESNFEYDKITGFLIDMDGVKGGWHLETT